MSDALAASPQRVTRRGEDAVVIVRASDYDALTAPKESLVEFFARSPRREIDIEIERSREYARNIDL
ncbi:MAG: type II toxin-antitoxin system Phd/YefM family antitoxin [Candidatus Eremiobacteraeota bacterium]|nr:type II toxin-antitoxin system Phd/YefM family antitoxin [Candidatus Eremiobacteraeota bacterium]